MWKAFMITSHCACLYAYIELETQLSITWPRSQALYLPACHYYEDLGDEIKPITEVHTAEYSLTDTTCLISRFLLTTQQTKQLPLMSTIMSMVSAVVKATSDDMTEGWQYYWATEVTVSENWKKKLPILFCAPPWIGFTQKPKILLTPFHIISWRKLVFSIRNSWYTHLNKFLVTAYVCSYNLFSLSPSGTEKFGGPPIIDLSPLYSIWLRSWF